MNLEFLENMGIAFIRVSKTGKVIQVQKDEFFDIETDDLNELLRSGNWLKDYERVLKLNQNQVGKVAKVGKKWISFEAYVREEYIDLKFTDVSKLQAERLIIIRNVVKYGYLLLNRSAPLLFGVVGLIWVAKTYFDYQTQNEKRKDLAFVQELKEERLKWFERMQKQDSTLIKQTQLLQKISNNLEISDKQNKIIADLTRFYKSAEEQNLALITDLTVIDYLIPDAGEKLSEIKKHRLSERFNEIKDSIEHERERKHKPFRK